LPVLWVKCYCCQKDRRGKGQLMTYYEIPTDHSSFLLVVSVPTVHVIFLPVVYMLVYIPAGHEFMVPAVRVIIVRVIIVLDAAAPVSAAGYIVSAGVYDAAGSVVLAVFINIC
ncbi:hypothetical protein Tco_0330019, partial [Tanacetum coccineum]